MSHRHYGSWRPSATPDQVQTVTPLDTRGPARLWNAPAGYVVRQRGAVGSYATNVYVCPVHGAFEARSDADAVACPTKVGEIWLTALPPIYRTEHCGIPSPWSPSPVAVWQSAGMVKG